MADHNLLSDLLLFGVVFVKSQHIQTTPNNMNRFLPLTIGLSTGPCCDRNKEDNTFATVEDRLILTLTGAPEKGTKLVSKRWAPLSFGIGCRFFQSSTLEFLYLCLPHNPGNHMMRYQKVPRLVVL